MSSCAGDRDRLQNHIRPGRPVDVLPASQFLQDRLQERRSRITRPKRSRHTDLGPRPGRDDDIFLHEAEESSKAAGLAATASSPLYFNGRASASDAMNGPGGSKRRAMGVRDMDALIDKLSKQNFDLKLEVDHRREQTVQLKEQIESMREQSALAEALATEHTELLKINSQLVEELEKRDRAIEEAMDIICDLEDRVAELEDRKGNSRPSTAQADSGYAGTEAQETIPPSSPPESNVPRTPVVNVRSPSLPAASAASQRLHNLMHGPTPGKSRRQPLALSHQKPSNFALRSVYLESTRELNPVKSFHSLLSRQESRADEDDDEALNSPRLSILSEGSFTSDYSHRKHISPEQYPWELAGDETPKSPLTGRAHLRQDSMKRVSQWISERNAAESTPSKSNVISAPLDDAVVDEMTAAPAPSKNGKSSEDDQKQQLNDALMSMDVSTEMSPFPPRRSRTEKQRLRPRPERPNSFAGPIFGEPLLPPTPDSVSTRMLRASRSSIIAEDRSLLDTTPAPVKQYAVLEPGIRTAPRQMRSSVELRNALDSNLQYRNTDLVNRRESSSDGEDHTGDLAMLREMNETSPESDAFSNDRELQSTTPRPILNLTKSPPRVTHAFIPAEPYSPPHRRRSSAEIKTHNLRPRLPRNDTSPIFVGSLSKMAAANATSSFESVTSPHSTHSGSSDTRTIVQASTSSALSQLNVTTSNPLSQRTVSPEFSRPTPLPRSNSVVSPSTAPTMSGMGGSSRIRIAHSPVRALSQKTQNLFRRLSNTRDGDRDAFHAYQSSTTPTTGRYEWEKSPLPTLTSTPSSAYHYDPPKRPRTSQGDQHHHPHHPTGMNHTPRVGGGTTTPRPPSARGRRPSVQSRSRTTDLSTTADSHFTFPARTSTSSNRESNGVRNSDVSSKDQLLTRNASTSDKDLPTLPSKDAAPSVTFKDAPSTATTASAGAANLPPAHLQQHHNPRKSLFRRSNSHKLPFDLSAAFSSGSATASPTTGSATSVLPSTPKQEDLPATPTLMSPISTKEKDESALISPVKDDKSASGDVAGGGAKEEKEKKSRRGSMRDAILAVSGAAAAAGGAGGGGGGGRRPWRQ
jgi:hypothetical protein